MRLLIINQHPTDALGGSEMQCDIIARKLTERGHQVIFGVVGKKRKEYYSGLPYIAIPLSIEKKDELIKLLHHIKPDIIYWRYNKRYLLRAARVCRQVKIPFVFAVSSVNDVTLIPQKPPMMRSQVAGKYQYTIIAISIIIFIKKTLSSLWNNRAFKYISAVTTLNSQFLGKLSVKNQCVIWNSVLDEIEPFEWERPYCVWVANLKPQKRPEAYIRLASIMRKKNPEVDFLMIGAIQNEQYKSLLEAAERMNNFYYLGFQSPEAVNGVLANAICLIHTCKPEGFGNNFIQAWMQGCPTISLEHDPENLIQQEQLGFLSGSLEKMANDVELLIRNKKLRDEIGNRAHDFSHINFSPERMVSEVESFLKEVIQTYKNT